ncbi:MAG: response regulator [Anaerolinea sp.]|nr:response regulator [Anaerolinea sp.]MCC6975298.1 response regulator [Anaerolineae bacterium]CAG1008692.1 Polar-differentiation response regulator DivK [Anaerolineae bacterium]
MFDLPRDLLKGWDIAVIDDEEDSLLVAQVILDEYGATTHTASNGEEGLEIIRRVKPRFVISDLSMPVLDGWGLINKMQNDPVLKDIPAIALTAHAMVGDRDRAVAMGFHNYLTKPLTVETFIQDLVNLLIDIPELAEELNI